jgi:hypothetical protein
MSTTNSVRTITKLASADLSGKLERFGVIDGSNRIAAAGAGTRIDGVIGNNDANAAGKPVQFQVDGVVNVKAAGAINPGAEVASDANGDAVAGAAGNYIGGIHCGETAAAAGDVIPVLLRFYQKNA